MSDDKITITRDHPSTANVQTLTFAKADSLGRVFVMANDDRSRFHMTLDRGEAYRVAEYLFGHDPGARPLEVEEFVGPLAERAPDGSILITDAGTRWFFNELARKLGKPVIEDLLATAASQAELSKPETFSFGRHDESAKVPEPRMATAVTKLDEHGKGKFTAYFDEGGTPPRTEWVTMDLATYSEAWRDGFPNAKVKVVVTIEDEEDADGD